jgi:hypothetical protein
LRGAAHGVPLERFAARLHQGDHRPGEVLAQHECGDDGQHGHDVRREASAQHATQRLNDQRSAAGDERR